MPSEFAQRLEEMQRVDQAEQAAASERHAEAQKRLDAEMEEHRSEAKRLLPETFEAISALQDAAELSARYFMQQFVDWRKSYPYSDPDNAQFGGPLRPVLGATGNGIKFHYDVEKYGLFCFGAPYYRKRPIIFSGWWHRGGIYIPLNGEPSINAGDGFEIDMMTLNEYTNEGVRYHHSTESERGWSTTTVHTIYTADKIRTIPEEIARHILDVQAS
jgi:hypothetical protein